MKKFIRIIVPVCLVLAVALSAAFSVVANGYTGSVDELNSLVEAAEDASGTEVDAALVAIADYLKSDPIAPGTDGLDAAMDRVYAVGIARVNEYVDAVAAAEDDSEKDGLFDAIAPLSVLFDIPADTQGYAECVTEYGAAALARARELIAEIDPALGTAKNGIAVGKLNSFIRRHVVLELLGDDYDTLLSDASAATAAHNEAMAEAFEALTANVAIGEYDYGILMNNDYSGTPDPKGLYGFSQRVGLDGSPNKVEASSGLDGDNSYLLFSYTAPSHSYIRTDLPKYEGGTVIEFDITTFDKLPDVGVELGSSSATTADGTRYYPGYADITKDGTLRSKTGKVLMENIITVGAWTHISMVFHQSTGLIDYYVNYEYLGSYDGTAGHPGTHNMHCFRIGSVNTNDGDNEYDGSFAVDNFKIYRGTSVRELDFLSSKNAEEKFAFYCGYLSKGSDDVKGLKVAYDYATENIKTYVSNGSYTTYFLSLDESAREMVEDAIAIYNDFDYEPIYVAYTKDNLELLISYADDIEKLGRGVDTVNSRRNAYEVYSTFLKSYENEIYADDGRFAETKSRATTLLNQINVDESIGSFIRFIDRFYLAFNAKAMESHYNMCSDIWQSLSAADRELRNRDEYADFKAAYERYSAAADILAAAKLEQVSKQIIECVEFIKEYDTLEEWEDEANKAHINKYLTLIRDFLRENENGTLKYDPYYAGVSEAIEIFEPINAYFFGLMQLDHIAVLEEQLEGYTQTEAYIEKMGICAYLRNYLKNNRYDIDEDNADINSLIERLDIYESELLECKEDYAELLEYNTAAFAVAVRKMQSVSGYAEMKAYYDEAVLCYYAMNVGDASIAEELAAFDEALGTLEDIEAASEAFVRAVAEYTLVDNEDDRFIAIIVCYENSRKASEDIDGVTEAMAEFNEFYAAYLESIGAANDEVSAAFGVISAQRANTDVAPVAGVITGIVTGR